MRPHHFGCNARVLIALLAGWGSNSAQAADVQLKAPATQPSLSWWYVGARAGVRDLFQRDVEYTSPRLLATVGASNDDMADFIGAVALGVHVPSSPFRIEIEYTYRSRANFERNTLGFCPPPCGGFAPANGLNFNGYNSIQYRNETVMLNSYWDFPIASRVAAFIGLGAGVSFHHTSANQWATVTFTPPDPVAIPPGVLAPFAAWPSRRSTSFAWSSTAGVSIDVAPRFVVDLSYRFAGLGRYDTGFNPNLFQDEKFRANVYSHEVLLGGRFRL